MGLTKNPNRQPVCPNRQSKQTTQTGNQWKTLTGHPDSQTEWTIQTDNQKRQSKQTI